MQLLFFCYGGGGGAFLTVLLLNVFKKKSLGLVVLRLYSVYVSILMSKSEFNIFPSLWPAQDTRTSYGVLFCALLIITLCYVNVKEGVIRILAGKS